MEQELITDVIIALKMKHISNFSTANLYQLGICYNQLHLQSTDEYPTQSYYIFDTLKVSLSENAYLYSDELV